ncbi:GNAT family N-acetyltransferase [Dictyobacter aurantiacus]|uniref:Acetyltransferase n=1 Tax=Dictyobacter aurantiacus TaxID=1936993 RepID=A0A401ZQ89_9CHLR|nr:GNAT family N-acetyltransferase [Dictyobacter aurantiacus]GCE08944.1 acetyltransferase [Dictyobacter aurantiacus]
MFLQTDRLLIREFQPDDFAALREVDADSKVQSPRGLEALPETQTRDTILYSMVAQQESPRLLYQLAIQLPTSPSLIGWCRLRLASVDKQEAELGYCLAYRFWGQGYATEAASSLLQFGFEVLCLHRIVAGCLATNRVSAHVLEKLGMRCEAHFRQNVQVTGIWHDSLVYAVLCEEWKQQLRVHEGHVDEEG